MLRRAAYLLSFLVATGVSHAARADDPPNPVRHYHHLWTDKDGISHLADCEVTHFFLKSMSPPAGPQWQDPMKPQTATIMFTVQPAHWNGAWHPDPKPQWIIPLHGSWWVQSMDGQKVVLNQGDVLLGEDQDVRPMPSGPYKGKKGHNAGNVGDDPVTLMVIQSANPPTIGAPCQYH